MGVSKSTKKPIPKKDKAIKATTGEPKFPYTSKPASLRRFLKEIPKKPRPPKFNADLLKSWGFSDTNDLTMLRVLKAVHLLNDKNEPTEIYSQFMSITGGAKVLGPHIQKIYEPLFQASHRPFDESNETLRNLFNIHSGGAERVLDYQIQTFKALCENAVFGSSNSDVSDPISVSENAVSVKNIADGPLQYPPTININLHIHLPENKGRRDYEAIIEDIGRYIFGRTGGNSGD